VTPRYLTTFEHASIPIGESAGDVSPAEAETLEQLSQRRPGFCERGYSSIRLAQYCGIVNVGGRLVEVLPKVGFGPEPEHQGRAHLIRLLTESGSISISAHDASAQSMARHTLLEIFIGAFLDRVVELARGGLRKDYIAFSEDLTVVRGRVDLQRQMTVLANRPDVIACHYDELTIDAPWNQAVKRALRVVKPWILGAELRRRWIDLAGLFDAVGDVALDASEVERFQIDRKSMRYRHARPWIVAILRLLSPSLRAGRQEAPSLLFDMNRVFQACVTRWLRREHSHIPEILITTEDHSQFFARHDGHRATRLYNVRPDLVIRRQDQVISIADTKWKRLSGNGDVLPDLGDVYQLFAYCGAFKCGSLSLIYPWHSSMGSIGHFAIRLPSIGEIRPRLKVVFVDIETSSFSRDPVEIDDWKGLHSAGPKVLSDSDQHDQEH
jgi:5-methylcytosine-specific restriction enzyme subunit McrC